ncbi:MAG: hypothetical protein AYK19_17790 [Theionarchaea archaeon DG-70-1]|nr:MAG: hypothetical protein AYK19_17790 [Theionarchaea archaeon DG-70-1]
MEWEEIILSALRNDEDLEIALKRSAQVAPKEILLAVENFPEDLGEIRRNLKAYPKVVSLLFLHIFAAAGDSFHSFSLEEQKTVLENSVDASFEASLISRDLCEKKLEALYLRAAGNSLHKLCRFSEAEKTLTESLEKCKVLARENPISHIPDVADTLNSLGALYWSTQRFSQAEKVYTESLEIYRGLTKQNPETHTEGLANILNNLGALYWSTQRFSQAEEVLTESLEIYRGLAKQNPEAYTLNVAMTLQNLGSLYLSTQRFSQAEKALKESLEIYRELARENPGAYTLHVSMALHNLGKLYSDTQRFSEAEKAYTEVLKIRRALAREIPEVYASHVAETLNSLGNLYKIIQEFSQAEKAFTEAVEIYRAFTRKNPTAYVPEMAMALHSLGSLYIDTERFSQAEKAFTEALELYRALARENPTAYTHYVAAILNSLGVLYRDTERFSEAEKTYTEALKIRRDLAREEPAVHAPDIAMILSNLGSLYSNMQRFSEAEKAFTDAVKIYKDLAGENPAAYTPYVAMILSNFGTFLLNINKFSEAEKVLTEALKAYKDLAKMNPEAYTPSIAMTLNSLGILYWNTHKFSQAEKAYTEELETYRDLARKNPSAHTSFIALALENLGNFYWSIQKFYQAEKALTEALKTYKDLANQNPEAHTSHVAMTLRNLGLLYVVTQKFSHAEETLTEALKTYKDLVNQNPEVYTFSVAGTMSSLGALYVSTKRFSQAEKVLTEALKMYWGLYKRNPGTYIPQIAETLDSLGNLHLDTQRFSEAEKNFTEAMEKWKKATMWLYTAKSAYNLSRVRTDTEILESSRRLLELAILFSKEEKYKYAQKGTHEYIYLNLLERDISTFSILEALRDPQLLSLPWSRILSPQELVRAQNNVEIQKSLVEDVLGMQIPYRESIPELSESLLFVYIQMVTDSLFFFTAENRGTKKFKCRKEFFDLGNKLLHNLRIQQWAAGRTHNMTFATEKFETLSNQWCEALPRELRVLIQEKDHIVFSPDHSCSFLPLEALHIEGRPLCIEKTVVRATSLHQFLPLLEKKPVFDSSLLIGNPWPKCGREHLVYSLPLPDSEKMKMHDLNGAEAEAASLMKLFVKLPQSTLLLRNEATGEQFLQEVIQHSLIHFSGHGTFGRVLFLTGPLQGFPPPFEPEEFSVLRKAERIEGDKRINMMQEWHPITDIDLYDVQLRDGAIVFLNACETGQQLYAGGGYYQGLPAVLLKNGALSVISSLVSIFDYPSKEFALHFYESLLKTHSVAESLKKARIWARDTYKAQIYWVPYLHYGPPF